MKYTNDSNFQFLVYTSPKGEVQIEVSFEEENVWLTQKRLSELFRVEVNTINYHLKEIFKSEELVEKSVIRKIRITASDGKKYLTNFYNLDAIISIGYRVNSYETFYGSKNMEKITKWSDFEIRYSNCKKLSIRI